MDVLAATTNTHKLRELRRLFAPWSIEVRSLPDLGLPALDVVEDGLTFEANARLKAVAYASRFNRPALADDSGISVDRLAGAPGVRSARFGQPSFDDTQRMRYLLECMRDIPAPERGAHYSCCIALATPDRSLLVAHGFCYGTLAEAPVYGATGFGYDPVFIPAGFSTPVSQLTEGEKDRIGHRGKAVRALIRRFEAQQRQSGTLSP